MSIPPDHFQMIKLQQHQAAQSLRNMYTAIDPRSQNQGGFITDSNHFGSNNQPLQHPPPPYVPPFIVSGIAPGPPADDTNGGLNLQFNHGLEPKKRKLEVQDFFENNSQISSVEMLHPLSVSTGLGLSLDNGQTSSSGDSSLLSLFGDELDKQLRQQDAEMDRFLKVQADRLRQAALEKLHDNQLKTVSFVESKVINKLQEKEAELQAINQKNMVLEEQIEQVNAKVHTWKQRAQYSENMVNALRANLQNVYAQNGTNQEGFGDCEIDDTASCCNGRVTDLHVLCKDTNDYMRELTTCKQCGVNKVCMLLLPCKHLNLCKACESKTSMCPQCQSSKFIGMEVYL